MKRLKFIAAASFMIIGAMIFTSCSTEVTEGDIDGMFEDVMDEDEPNIKTNTETDNDAETPLSEKSMYQCPDNCQEGRAYFEEGKCKGCDKDLVEI